MTRCGRRLRHDGAAPIQSLHPPLSGCGYFGTAGSLRLEVVATTLPRRCLKAMPRRRCQTDMNHEMGYHTCELCRQFNHGGNIAVPAAPSLWTILKWDFCRVTDRNEARLSAPERAYAGSKQMRSPVTGTACLQPLDSAGKATRVIPQTSRLRHFYGISYLNPHSVQRVDLSRKIGGGGRNRTGVHGFAGIGRFLC
ncbi:MAG: hypothetical protein H6R12_1013 [Proteobacteria bacterium]|nr:hypothetical protein [Pseudomonadota bacterium]